MAKIRKNRKNGASFVFSDNIRKQMGATRIRDLGMVGLLILLYFSNMANQKLFHIFSSIVAATPVVKQLVEDIKVLKGNE